VAQEEGRRRFPLLEAIGDSPSSYPPGFEVAALLRQAAEAGGPRRHLLPYQLRFTIIDLPAAPEQEEVETKPDVTCLQPLNKKERRANKRKEVNPTCLLSMTRL